MKKTIIVTDKDYDAVLFSYKASHPTASIKIVHPDEFVSLISFSFKKDPIPYLLSLGYDYVRAKKIMKAVLVGDIDKNEKLKTLFSLLNDANFFSRDPYGKFELSQSDVCFFEMQEDIELHALAKRNAIPYHDFSIGDLGIEMRFPEEEKHPTLFSFKNKFLQFSYIYSDIRRRLLDGEKPSSIRIHIQNESDDLFYVNLCSSLFDIESFVVVSTPLLSNYSVGKKIADIHKNHSFSFTEEEKDDPYVSELYDIVTYFALDKLPFDKGYASLLEIVSSLSSKAPTNDKGIVVCADSLIDLSSSTYVTDFVDGSFYKSFEDDNILNDEELLSASLNPSYVLTALDRRKKLNYIRYTNIAFLSRVEEHLSDSIYPSPFMNELSLYKNSKMERVSFNENGIYTFKAKELLMGKELDDAFYYKPHEEFRSYDHRYKKIEGYMPLIDQKPYSVTKLESYINCPFKFLMSELLPSNSEELHALYLGILIHKIMERIYDDDFSFDDAFQEGKEAYLEGMKSHHQEYGAVEEAYLKIYYHHLKRIVSELRAWKVSSSIRKEIPEQQIEWNLYDERGREYHFSGRIDKIIEFGTDNSHSYYYLIDYKTGLERFDPETVFLGKCIQLPLYYYALRANQEFKESLVGDASFGGFGIQQMFATSLKSAYKDNDGFLSEASFYKKSAFKGVVLSSDDEAFWHLADETSFVEKKNTIISSGEGTFLSGKGRFFTPEEGSILDKKKRCYSLNELMSDAIIASIRTINLIEDAEFPIKPTGSSDLTKKPDLSRLSCAYCPYKDICYHNAGEDYKDYSREITERFADEDKGNDDGE